MGLENVLLKIEKDTNEEVNRILAEAEQRADDIIRTAKMDAEKRYKESVDRTRRMAEAQLKQEICGAELEAKKRLLNVRRQLLECAYIDCVKSLSDAEHEKIIPALIARSKRDMPDGSFIYSNKRDEPLVRKTSPNMEYAGNIECCGGVVIENRERNVRIDLTYETLAQSIWNKNLKKIYVILFDGKKEDKSDS